MIELRTDLARGLHLLDSRASAPVNRTCPRTPMRGSKRPDIIDTPPPDSAGDAIRQSPDSSGTAADRSGSHRYLSSTARRPRAASVSPRCPTSWTDRQSVVVVPRDRDRRMARHVEELRQPQHRSPAPVPSVRRRRPSARRRRRRDRPARAAAAHRSPSSARSTARVSTSRSVHRPHVVLRQDVASHLEPQPHAR